MMLYVYVIGKKLELSNDDQDNEGQKNNQNSY